MDLRPWIDEPGIIAEGRAVLLARPTPEEVQAILQLWEKPYVGRSARFPFLPNPSDFSTWLLLRLALGAPYRATLGIRFRPDGRLVGSIGWTGWDPQARTVWVGDLAVDYSVLKSIGRQWPAGYPGVAVDAVTALTGFLFERLEVETVETFIAETNGLARQVARRAGFREVGRFLYPVPTGPPVPAVVFRLSRC
ncbi:MAG: GNAT family N-acetyltransferase [Acidobacteria bacterium]|nr:GNAT family N-acetyltransferase [Acidobacteriota bacterium]MDW7983948.1 GNAT family N-acetyltransferase [Acidobacteriota bacterium]